jgi:hypothetical protein
MIVIVRAALLGVTLLAAGAGGPAAELPAAGAGRTAPGHGACYCRMGKALRCTANLSEQECHRQCDEAICDDWFWKDRLPCWNWGYGG